MHTKHYCRASETTGSKWVVTCKKIDLREQVHTCMNGIIKTKSLQTFLAGLILQMCTLKGMSSRDNKYFLHLITSNVSNTVTIYYRILKKTLRITNLFCHKEQHFALDV